MNVVKNDSVLIIAGNQRGKKGRVLKVFPEKNRIIVEGINLIKRHTKPSTKNTHGGIVEKEASINASNVMVICNRCGQPTRVGRKALSDGAKIIRVRTCAKCNEVL
ncbi:50S ribosomal protein L24 [bacterium]|nr:50S ribosomal protein L24 [bacterium]